MIANATKDKLNSTSSEYPSKFPIKTWKWYIFWKSQVWQDCVNPLAVEQRGEYLSQDWMFHEIFPFKYVLAFELNLCFTCTVSTDIGCRFSHLWHPLPTIKINEIMILYLTVAYQNHYNIIISLILVIGRGCSFYMCWSP